MVSITTIIISAITLVSKMWNCSNVIKEQYEHNINFTFVHVKFPPWEILDGSRKLHPSKPKHITHTRTHLKHPPTTTSHHRCYKPHHPQLGPQLSLRFQISLLLPLHSSSQAGTLLVNQVFFKMNCHIYCSIYMFLNHLIYVKLGCHFYQVPIHFYASLTKFPSVVSNAIFPLCPVGFIAQVCKVWWILGTCIMLKQN